MGETPSQCAVRETEEGTGVRVEPVSVLLQRRRDPAGVRGDADRPADRGRSEANDEAGDVRWGNRTISRSLPDPAGRVGRSRPTASSVKRWADRAPEAWGATQW
ncbi:NUDIX domain-containing protein [Nonomuraea angiospora]|uniref:NUDIX hydrolase n=1 Tax=Nonomuraea angiospora TaxID=46172 RepID=UPI003418A441